MSKAKTKTKPVSPHTNVRLQEALGLVRKDSPVIDAQKALKLIIWDLMKANSAIRILEVQVKNLRNKK